MADVAPPELKAAIAAERAQIVCGAGVSMAATGGTAPSWAQLIRDSLAEAARINNAAGNHWVNACEALLESNEVGDWLNGANTLHAKLDGPSRGPYPAFFKQRLGSLKPANPAIVRALKRLADAGNCIATTNYDHLIADALGWDRVEWTDPRAGYRGAVWRACRGAHSRRLSSPGIDRFFAKRL